MCMMNNQPVSTYCSPCVKCPEYLNSCLPVIINGFIYGECDFVACEFCNYEDCQERSC